MVELYKTPSGKVMFVTTVPTKAAITDTSSSEDFGKIAELRSTVASLQKEIQIV